jgi:hypothetical protein
MHCSVHVLIDLYAPRGRRACSDTLISSFRHFVGAIKFRNVFLKEHHRRCMDVFNIIQDRIKLIISINVSQSNCQVLCLIYIEKLGHHLFLLKPDINYLQQYTRGLWWSNSAARL